MLSHTNKWSSNPTSVNHTTTPLHHSPRISLSLSISLLVMELVQRASSCFIHTAKFSSPQKRRHLANSSCKSRKKKSQTNTTSSNFARTKSLVVRASDEVDTAVVLDKPTLRPPRFQVFDGSPAPYGATARDGGVNFAVFSMNAVSATLCLTTLSDLQDVCLYPCFALF